MRALRNRTPLTLKKLWSNSGVTKRLWFKAMRRVSPPLEVARQIALGLGLEPEAFLATLQKMHERENWPARASKLRERTRSRRSRLPADRFPAEMILEHARAGLAPACYNGRKRLYRNYSHEPKERA